MKKKERISQKAIRHSSLGEFSQGSHKHPPRMLSGGHGEENLRELRRRAIPYTIKGTYPNGVRLGSVTNHFNKGKRERNMQTWFPKSWGRKSIKQAGEKVINSIPYKLPDGKTAYGTFKKVKVGVMRTNGKVSTVFPDYNQRGRLRK